MVDRVDKLALLAVHHMASNATGSACDLCKVRRKRHVGWMGLPHCV